jgi:DNA gyrase subunit A
MIAPVTDDNDVIMITTDGVVIRTHADQISTFKRPSKGVRVMKVKEGEKLATLSIVDKFVEEEIENTEATDEAEVSQQTQETNEE